MSELSDEEILSMFRRPEAGEKRQAFNLIFRKYREQVYHLIRRMVIDHDDTDDLVQNTFVNIWNNLDKFREESKLYTWIYRIATNEALGFLKKKRTRFFLPINDVEGELAGKIAQLSWFNTNKVELKLQQAILKLPPRQRLVFQLRYFDEMKYEDISSMLGTSTGALKASYHHAVNKVEKYMLDEQ